MPDSACKSPKARQTDPVEVRNVDGWRDTLYDRYLKEGPPWGDLRPGSSHPTLTASNGAFLRSEKYLKMITET